MKDLEIKEVVFDLSVTHVTNFRVPNGRTDITQDPNTRTLSMNWRNPDKGGYIFPLNKEVVSKKIVYKKLVKLVVTRFRTLIWPLILSVPGTECIECWIVTCIYNLSVDVGIGSCILITLFRTVLFKRIMRDWNRSSQSLLEESLPYEPYSRLPTHP